MYGEGKMYNWNEESFGFIKFQEGEQKTLVVKKVEKTTGKYNLKKNNEDLGWYIALTTDKGILSVNSWGLYYECQKADVKGGKTYNFKCISKGGLGKAGQWEIEEVSPF